LSERTELGLGVLGAAAVLGLLGDLLLRAAPWGLNVFLWVLALGALVWAVAAWRGVVLHGEGRWLAVPLLLFSALFVWRDSNTLAIVNGLALLIALSLAALRTRSGRLVVAGLADYFYWGLQAVTYAYAGLVPLALKDVAWRDLRPVGFGPVLAVVRGLIIAVPLLLLFGPLFVAADAVFEGLVSKLFDFDIAELVGHLFLFALFAWISAGLLRLALVGGEFPPVQRPPYLRLGIVELGVALGLLNILFSLFVFVQVRYFFGGEELVSSLTGLTYAEYARRGFFELVTVTALVLPLLLLAHWLLQTDKRSHMLLFALLAGSLVGLLFVVMASALQRMRLYTEAFGLTELRLYTSAFVLWIFAVLVWFLLTVLRNRREYFAVGTLITGFVAIAVLNLLNPDALIVKTNVARMQDGKTFDASYLTSLSADAVPPLLASLGSMSEADRRTVEEALRSRWSSSGGDWRTYNLGRSRAREMVNEDLSGNFELTASSPRQKRASRIREGNFVTNARRRRVADRRRLVNGVTDTLVESRIRRRRHTGREQRAASGLGAAGERLGGGA